jgi:shikimate dehydrogenase
MATAPDFKQQLTGVFGQPVAENPSQPMVEAAYRHHRLPWRYLTIEVAPAGLRAAVEGARAMGFRGFNCTIPHKLAVVPHLDGLGESARLMGAVNCVVRRGDQLIGENTDGKGFVQALRRISDPAGKKVVILGAGGAARAIAVELALCGAAALVIVNRGAQRRTALVDLLRTMPGIACTGVPWSSEYAIPGDAQVVVNATSIGLFPDVDARLAIAADSLTPAMVIADVIPNPPRTRFIRDAAARGCRVIDGLEMLVGQGAIGIRYWTGIDPDTQVMRQALEEIFAPGQRAVSTPG